MLLQRRVLGKTEKSTRKLLNTPKIAVPKAVAYFNTLPIDLPKVGQPNLTQFLQDDTILSCSLPQRHARTKTRNQRKMSLITPKIAVPKAVAYSHTLPNDLLKAGHPNPP